MFSYIKALLNKPIIFRILFGLWCATYLVKILLNIIPAPLIGDYVDFNLSDWMINYQAGFVRRGLWGELLFLLYQFHPFPLRTVVFLVMLLTFIALLLLLIRLFKKNSWSYVLLPSCAMILPAMALCGFWTRKDYLLLLGAFFLFQCYHNWFNGRHCILNYIGLQAIGILLMLTHEASLFFTIPILFCHLLGHKHRKMGAGFIRSTLKTFVFFLPVIVSWLAVCLCKGNSDMANAIWDSWKPAMEAYPIPTDSQRVGQSIVWLGHTFWPTAQFHLQLNFVGDFLPHVPSLPFTLYCYVAIYYVVTRMNTVDLCLNKTKPLNSVLFSNIVLMQFLFMLPMFTVLSCDGMRTVPYWIVSSLFLFHFFSHQGFPLSHRLTVFSERIQKWMDGKRLLNNRWFYLFVIITIPLSSVGHASFYYCLPCTVFWFAWNYAILFYHHFVP